MRLDINQYEISMKFNQFNHETNIMWKAKHCADRNGCCLYSFSRKVLNYMSSSNLWYNFN